MQEKKFSAKKSLLTAEEEVELNEIIRKGIESTRELKKLGVNDSETETETETETEKSPKAKTKSTPKLKRLKAESQAGQEASDKFIKSNMGLVVYLAQRYKGRGLSEQDLIQEGYLALVHSVKRFDASKGNRFSTYASQWIAPAMTKAIKTQSQMIKMPQAQISKLIKLNQAHSKLESELERDPTTAELAKEMNESQKEVEDIMRARQTHLSLEYGAGEESGTLGDTLEYSQDLSTAESIINVDNQKLFSKEILDVLDELDEISKDVLIMRFGLDGQPPKEVKKVAEAIKLKTNKTVTAARIRHIEDVAIRTLRSKVPDMEKLNDLL